MENVDVATDFGEAQILSEILAVASVNTKEEVTDQTLFAVRVISTYVTFYCAIIHKGYWDELAIGCPRQQSITIFRWSGDSSNPFVGFDLAEPNGRINVLEALCKIRQYILE